MADDRYNWLDKDTAERLLRGEPVSARRGDGAHELEQLLKAAAAVGAEAPGTAPLPGEETALAAFRQAARAGARSRGADAPPAAVGSGRATGLAERTRLARPLRRGFAVALAVCAIGGVAVAAGTGVLPTPFEGGDPAPGSSVSAAESPGPLDTREPGAETDGTTARTPDATPGGGTSAPARTPTPGTSPGATGTPGTPGGGAGRDDRPGGGKGNGVPGTKKQLLLGLCRNYESGNRNGMDRDALRRLEKRAGGADKVHAFCRAYLARYGLGGGSGDNDGFTGGLGGSGTGGDSGQSGDPGGDQEGGPAPSPPGTTTPGTATPSPSPSVTSTDSVSTTPGTTATS
ncbi:hypothetical protein [Streptomyces lydicus]|uniref:Extensin n=1 Tax=Streptomyces lydicus TaxID=47763 RepID=A0A1D7VTQ5_9ACTN|nr:hypothetical protein [Streptomyces lydicus]AOP50155.1 hypothetical protein SL103_31345 [Streptomyces lydicus]